MSTTTTTPMAPSSEQEALQQLPPLPRHDAAVAAGREGLLDVAIGGAGAGGCTQCVASRIRFGYPLKLMVPSHLASMAPPDRALAADATDGAAMPLPRPVWCYVVGYGGGLVAGDGVALSVRVAPGSTAVLATQASTKVYHARARAQPSSPLGAAVAAAPASAALHAAPAVSSLAAAVGAGGLLAVLPDPVIAFQDARFRQRQSVALAPGGSLVLLDWCSSGRRARGEAWAFASYESRTEVLLQRQAGGPACALLVDAVRLQGSAAAPLPERMGRAHVVGVLILTGPRVAAHAAALLRDLDSFTPVCFSRGRAAGLAAAAGPTSGGQPPPPFFFAAGCALEGGEGGAVIRLAAESADDAYAWARAALAPLHAQLGGAPYRL